MNSKLNLVTIPKERYLDYRYDVIFNAYKWDPQVEDHNTISQHVLVIDNEEVQELEQLAEQLAAETLAMEKALINNLHLATKLGLPAKIRKKLPRLKNYDETKNIRLMRFDFHPTTTGWAISEVNSDVPGGLAESSILPQVASKYLPNYFPGKSVANALLEAFQEQVQPNGQIAFVHATAYSDDRQVMQFLGDYFADHGYNSLYVAPDHLEWNCGKAQSILSGEKIAVDGIVRFFPLEWLTNFSTKIAWENYYDTTIPSCNHPAAILTQSKKLPLIWDELNIDLSTWKKLLPETTAVNKVQKALPDWILKPALGRVGEGISIKSAITAKELKKIEKQAYRNPKHWIAQKMFQSTPLQTAENEAYHLCIGVFTVNGKAAGFYGRISLHARIDEKAKDIPILVKNINKSQSKKYD